MRRRGFWDRLTWGGKSPGARAAYSGAIQGALLCALAHGAVAGAVVIGKAAFGFAAPPPADEFAQAVAIVALSSTLCAALFGAPLLLLLGRLDAAGTLTCALGGAVGGFAVAAFCAWTWPPFEWGMAAFLAWYGATTAAAICWRARAVERALT